MLAAERDRWALCIPVLIGCGISAYFAAAAEPTPAPTPPTPAHVYSSDTPIAMVAGEKVTEVSFVATHCVALQRYLEFTLNLPAPPPPLARLELADVPGYAPVETRVVAGTVLVVLRLGDGQEAPALAGEAAAQAWLARVALLAGKATDASEPWTRQALACEVVAQLRPSMNDHWYRRAAGRPGDLGGHSGGQGTGAGGLLVLARPALDVGRPRGAIQDVDRLRPRECRARPAREGGPLARRVVVGPAR